MAFFSENGVPQPIFPHFLWIILSFQKKFLLFRLSHSKNSNTKTFLHYTLLLSPSNCINILH